jgi:lycopene beta-cyclase
LPFSETQALVEYTVFSSEVFPAAAYDLQLSKYLERTLACGPYSLIDTEQGQIPMTNYKFPVGTGHIINLGTSGGQTKGSSGYTFHFIQKHSAAIVEALENAGSPILPSPAKRFGFYDRVLLEILATRKLEGSDIFLRLFEKNSPADVLKFLDNETTLSEELAIIASLPMLPFARAAIKQF